MGFIANRNILIAATFGISALVWHDRWRRGGSRPAGLAAVVLLGLALFSKEEGIGTCAYLGAYALFVDPKGWRRGCLALVPYAALVVVWRALRGSWGYGVQNVGVYIDPLTDPGPFLAALPDRVPILLLGQWGPVPAEVGGVLRGPAWTVFWGSAVGLIGLLAFVVAPLLKRDRIARFWAAGMLFATIPVCATLPMDRLLTFAGVGAFGLLAQFWAFVLDPPAGFAANRWWRIPARGLAWFFVGAHAVWAPLALPFRALADRAVLDRGSFVGARATGSGDRREDAGHRECAERRACGVSHVSAVGQRHADTAAYSRPGAGNAGGTYSPGG